MKPILLSIDMDFFSFEDPMWDWDHSETHNSNLAELLWSMRLAANGETLLEATSITKADIHPGALIPLLRGYGWTFDPKCVITISDSHVYAYQAWESFRNVRIINFDAHHDLGYTTPDGMRYRWKEQRVQCEDWLWFLLRRHRSMDAVTVYPTWKCATPACNVDQRFGDWPHNPHWRGTSIERRTRPVKFSLSDLRRLAGNVVGIHIARSDAWLPPWQDCYAVELIHSAMAAPFHRTFVKSLGPVCPLYPRKFNTTQVLGRAHPLHQLRGA